MRSDASHILFSPPMKTLGASGSRKTMETLQEDLPTSTNPMGKIRQQQPVAALCCLDVCTLWTLRD